MSADVATATIAARQHGLVTRTQLLRCGLSPDQIRRRGRAGALERLAPGVFRVRGAPVTWPATVLAAVLASGPTAVASHRTAAHLLGLEGCRRPTGAPEVTVVRPARGRRELAVVHQTTRRRPTEVIEVEGIPCTRVERTLLDLAAVAPRGVVEAALDGALRDGRTGARRLRRLLEPGTTQGVPGAARLTELVGIGGRPESWLERRTLALLRAAGLPTPELQQVRHDRSGFVARIDLSLAGGTVVVEVNGHRTHATRRQRQRDHERANRLALLGIVVLQFTYEDVVERPDHVVALIRDALRRSVRRELAPSA
jgi:hypothetical protein